MTPSEIEIGMKFGHWEVIKYDHTNKHRIKYFLCRCSVCGAVRPVRASALLNGTSTCCSSKCSQTLIGQYFGKWQVLAEDKSHPGNYMCRCSCGTTKSICRSSLILGTSKSCGCSRNKTAKIRYKKNAENHIGEKWGLLTVLSYCLKGDSYCYHCQCKCGQEIDVIEKNLFSGNTYSCGCVNFKANENMEKLLTQLHIPFKKEYKFEDCKNQRSLLFNFALFNEQEELIGLIENNGSQHYSARGTGWNMTTRSIHIQKQDYIKQLFAEENKIPLLIIPYQYFDSEKMKQFLMTSDFWNIIIRNFND